jgi:hypothetical protein
MRNTVSSPISGVLPITLLCCLLLAGPAGATVGVSVVDDTGYPRAQYPSRGTVGNGASRGATISANGRYVAFVSDASSLTFSQETRVCLRDQVTGDTLGPAGAAVIAQG